MAYEAHGSPLSAGIRSINNLPLVMDAHQPLGASIPLARCREIEVEIENRDDRDGSIQMAVLLADSSDPGKSELYLGQQPILSTQAEPVSIDSEPALKPVSGPTSAFETLQFAIPPDAKIRKFDEITVMLLSDGARALAGPKIAIRQFQIFPR